MAVSGNVAGTAKRGVSYAPNQALIKGQGDVAKSEAAINTLGGMAFAQNFTGAFVKGIEEQEKRNAIREAYLDDLKNPQNMLKIEEGYNKQAITEFLNKNKDEYAKAADCYSRTRDRGCREKMDEIKFRFSNLNTQLDLYLNDKKEYLDAFKEGQIVDIPEVGDDKYTELYTNKGAFSIEENGDLGFTINNEYSKYNDIVGNYHVKNNIYDTHMLKSAYNAEINGARGIEFNRRAEKNATAATLKQTGYDGIMTATRSDFGIDDDYVLGKDENGNDIKAGKLTFEAMFTGGLLADKYYDGSLTGTAYKKGDSSWFWDKKNSKDLANLIAEYSTDVNEYVNKQNLEKYNAKRRPQTTGPSTYYLSGVAINSESFNAVIPKFIKDLQNLKDGEYEKNTITGAGFVRKGKNKDGNPIYYRVLDTKDGKPIIDEDLGPMDLQGVGRYEGWGNYFSFTKEDPLNPNE